MLVYRFDSSLKSDFWPLSFGLSSMFAKTVLAVSCNYFKGLSTFDDKWSETKKQLGLGETVQSSFEI